jgi:hypothetical protein
MPSGAVTMVIGPRSARAGAPRLAGRPLTELPGRNRPSRAPPVTR